MTNPIDDWKPIDQLTPELSDTLKGLFPGAETYRINLDKHSENLDKLVEKELRKKKQKLVERKARKRRKGWA